MWKTNKRTGSNKESNGAKMGVKRIIVPGRLFGRSEYLIHIKIKFVVISAEQNGRDTNVGNFCINKLALKVRD